jgi:hypothetical protein
MKKLLFIILSATTIISCKDKPEVEAPKIKYEEVKGYSFDNKPTLDSINYGEEVMNAMNRMNESMAKKNGDSTYVTYVDANKPKNIQPEMDTKQKDVLVITSDSIFKEMIAKTESSLMKHQPKTKIDFTKEFVIVVSNEPSQFCQCVSSASLTDLNIKNNVLFANIYKSSIPTEYGSPYWQVHIYKFKKEKLKKVEFLYNDEKLEFKL